jgi:serine/threonine protein kinase
MLKFDEDLEESIENTNLNGYFYYNSKYINNHECFEELMLKSVVKLIDLGFAKDMDFKGYATSFLGTPAYIAPEILKKKSNDVTANFHYSSKVDTWSIGVIAFQLLTGQIPFTINENIKDFFKDLYNLHKIGIYKINYSITLTSEFLDLINALLQFNEENRINIDDLVMHPFFTKNIDIQNPLAIKDLIKNNSKYLECSSKIRTNYLMDGTEFTYSKEDKVSILDTNLIVNDEILDEIFDIKTKIIITFLERLEDDYVYISMKKENILDNK